MKIIFLDVDGVITSPRVGWRRFDIFAVQFLNWLCREIDAKIVISSTWRYNHPKEEFEQFFTAIHEDWRTDTDLLRNGTNCRGDEIQLWLNNHPEVTQYIILDDDQDMLDSQIDRCVFTNYEDGLVWSDMLLVKLLFNIDNTPYNADTTDIPPIEALHNQINRFKTLLEKPSKIKFI